MGEAFNKEYDDKEEESKIGFEEVFDKGFLYVKE